MHCTPHKVPKHVLLTLTLFVLMGLVSACSMDFIKKDPLAFLTDEDKSAAPPPPSETQPDPVEEIALMDPKPGMLSTMGLNLDTYFAENTKNRDDRIARLEQVVSAIHKDLKSVAPPVGRFVGMEAELEKHLNSYPLVPTTQQPQTIVSPYPTDKMQPESVMEKPQAIADEPPQSITTKTIKSVPPADSKPKPTTNGATVTSLRTGIHKDKIRIVLDVSEKTSFSADLDNNENILVIDVANAGWSAANEKTFGSKMPVLQSYRADPNGKGTLLAIQLKQSSAILYQKAIPATSGSGQRIVIDLQR